MDDRNAMYKQRFYDMQYRYGADWQIEYEEYFDWACRNETNKKGRTFRLWRIDRKQPFTMANIRAVECDAQRNKGIKRTRTGGFILTVDQWIAELKQNAVSD